MNVKDEHGSEAVNFYDEVMNIKKRYDPNYWRNPSAIKELADFWGVSSNSSGVIPHQAETIVHIGRCKGQIYFAQTSKGYWLTGLSASSSFNGVSYAPSVTDTIGYKSYQNARKEGVKKLIDFFNAVTHDLSSCNSEANRANGLKAVSFLKPELTPQLNLFE